MRALAVAVICCAAHCAGLLVPGRWEGMAVVRHRVLRHRVLIMKKKRKAKEKAGRPPSSPAPAPVPAELPAEVPDIPTPLLATGMTPVEVEPPAEMMMPMEGEMMPVEGGMTTAYTGASYGYDDDDDDDDGPLEFDPSVPIEDEPTLKLPTFPRVGSPTTTQEQGGDRPRLEFPSFPRFGSDAPAEVEEDRFASKLPAISQGRKSEAPEDTTPPVEKLVFTLTYVGIGTLIAIEVFINTPAFQEIKPAILNFLDGN